MYVHYPTGFQPQSPRWRNYRRWYNRDLPGSIRRWLLDSGSLTTRLVKASNNDFRVQRISQHWGQARRDEYRLLGIEPQQRCLIREVLLLCHGQPWVYARSVLPVTSLVGPLRHLRKFGNQPLGQLLFNTPGMQRQPFELAQFEPANLPNAAQLPGRHSLWPNAETKPLWGRRSRFELHGRPVMVSEIFLPAFRP